MNHRQGKCLCSNCAVVAADLSQRDQSPVYQYLKSCLRIARKNSCKKRRKCTITEGDLWWLLIESRGACAVTGVRFSLDKHRAGRRPLAPSLDRIDPFYGYIPGNVRLVCQIANLAMNVWGQETLCDFICRAYPTLSASQTSTHLPPRQGCSGVETVELEGIRGVLSGARSDQTDSIESISCNHIG